MNLDEIAKRAGMLLGLLVLWALVIYGLIWLGLKLFL